MSSSIVEVLVAALALALRESQGYGNLATGLQALSPERTGATLTAVKGTGVMG